MSDIVINAENLGKKYVIGHHAEASHHVTLREALTHGARSFWRKTKDLAQGRPIILGDTLEEVWALNDVSFEIQRGEAVGIIGPNGAGKSTLLKILSRITEPSTGRVTIKGRVASLLEVGTGFHPELTGRENIYLNGSILGMTRAEIKRNFDEIVAFAEVEKFLDTPVKRYSSGMYVRLAFAVAAHLEPEILLVDEVLAVGDTTFQKKCLGKMRDVAKEGRTVLFVTHNMGAITRLCRRAVLLEGGRVEFDGSADEATIQYLARSGAKMGDRSWDLASAPGDEVAKLLEVRVKQRGVSISSVDIRLPVVLEMVFLNLKPQANLICAFSLFNDQGVHLFNAVDFDNKHNGYAPGKYTAEFTIPGNLFAEGVVSICVEVSTRAPVYQIHFLEYDAAAFQVIDNGEPGSVRSGWGRPIPGVVRPKVSWRISPSSTFRTFPECKAAGADEY